MVKWKASPITSKWAGAEGLGRSLHFSERWLPSRTSPKVLWFFKVSSTVWRVMRNTESLGSHGTSEHLPCLRVLRWNFRAFCLCLANKCKKCNIAFRAENLLPRISSITKYIILLIFYVFEKFSTFHPSNYSRFLYFPKKSSVSWAHL